MSTELCFAKHFLVVHAAPAIRRGLLHCSNRLLLSLNKHAQCTFLEEKRSHFNLKKYFIVSGFKKEQPPAELVQQKIRIADSVLIRMLLFF